MSYLVRGVDFGDGGGAGGLVVLASDKYIANRGNINVSGGDGGASTINGNYAVGPGGGGSAGDVFFIRSHNRNNFDGTVTHSGGSAGDIENSDASRAYNFFGGAGGGNLVVGGGDGGSIEGHIIQSAGQGASGSGLHIVGTRIERVPF